MKKQIFKIKDMHCTSCPVAIEMELEEAGITAHGSYPRGEVEVEFDERKFTDKDIIAIIKKAGYTVGV